MDHIILVYSDGVGEELHGTPSLRTLYCLLLHPKCFGSREVYTIYESNTSYQSTPKYSLASCMS